MILESFEITCLKWLKNHTCAPIKPSANLILKSNEVKCYQKWLKMWLNQNFTVLFSDSQF